MKKQVLLTVILLITSVNYAYTIDSTGVAAGPEARAGIHNNGIDGRLDNFTQRLITAPEVVITAYRSARHISICQACAKFIYEFNQQIAYNILDERGVSALS